MASSSGDFLHCIPLLTSGSSAVTVAICLHIRQYTQHNLGKKSSKMCCKMHKGVKAHLKVLFVASIHAVERSYA
uniref:Uncharacterized protein n=1 Tax=Anguilla anguilla TaxID=7936 RepID=A0A0E9WL32_ANGAN